MHLAGKNDTIKIHNLAATEITDRYCSAYDLRLHGTFELPSLPKAKKQSFRSMELLVNTEWHSGRVVFRGN